MVGLILKLFTRIRALRCTSDRTNNVQTVSHLKEKFLQRGYPYQLFCNVASTLPFDKREGLLRGAEKKELEPNVTIFCATHHPSLPSSTIRGAISDEQTPFVPMVVRRRATSHGDDLVRARVTAGRHPNIPPATHPQPDELSSPAPSS